MPNNAQPTAIALPVNIDQPTGAALQASMIFDSTVEEYSPRIDWTDHPVESGQDVTDHSQIKPLEFTLRGTITETPLAGSNPTTGTSALPIVGPQRLLAAYQFLVRCEGQIVVVSTARWGTFASCGITGYRHTVDAAGRVVFTVTIKQIRIATSGRVTIPPLTTAIPGSSTAGNVGAQSLQAVPPAQVANVNRTRSTALALSILAGTAAP